MSMLKVKRKTLFILGIAIVMILLAVTSSYAVTSQTTENPDHVYLSNISYLNEKSFVQSAYSILLDKNQDSDFITLNVNGKKMPFLKGICAWATSEIVYDLREYDYDYFTSYIGVDASEQSDYFNTGAKFYIYTSVDGDYWEERYQSDILYGWSEAPFIKINIKDANYLKLVADENQEYPGDFWSPWYDETVYADAKLIKESYVEDTAEVDFIKTVEEYDKKIKTYSVNQEITGEFEIALLQREFVKNVGYDLLQQFVRYSDENYQVISWLMNNVDNLRLYIIGGEPDGSYMESLRVLSKLYATYKDDLNKEDITANGTALKNLYRKMMISLSLTHSTDVGLWAGGMTNNPNDPNNSYAVTRYEIYKKMHQEGKLDSKIFESLTIEEMRFVTNNIIDDEEIEWLNAYTTEHNSRNPYSYIEYTFGYEYSKSEYYDPSNYEKWNQKYNLSKYNITYQTGYPKLWIVFEEGGVCGALSKTGSNIWGSYGVPSSVVSQPGHAAYIYYSLDSNGNGIWNLYNDISGWQQSGKTEKLTIRMPNGWGNGSYASQYPVPYVLLAQGALNDFDNYEKSEEILLLANTYKGNEEELYNIYRKALEVQPLNFDAWHGLVNLYISDDTKTSEEKYILAQEIANSLKYYPLPMHDLLKLIEPSIEETEYTVALNVLLTKTLTEGTMATSNETIQEVAVREVANYLLGNTDTEIATFSFDGENAGAIVLGSRFEGVGVAWEYSLNNQETWTQVHEHKVQLTNEEIESITAENDILVHIVGAGYEEENIYRIDILKGTIPTNLYNNDLENKIIGATDLMEWKYTENDSWTSYKEQIPDLTGDKTVTVRTGATGVYLPSDELTFSFTEDNQLDTQKYISIDHLSIFQVSSEELGTNEGAQNAIDGNIHTMWHSSWNGDDSERYIIIELDEPKYISALEYVPRQIGNNGRIKEGQILVSMDGKTWTDVATITNWADSPDSKMVVFDEVIKSQYVKLVATENYGDGRDFITATMINLFEDTTQKEESEIPPNEEEKPGEIPDETLPENPDEEQKPEQKPEEKPTPDEEEKPEGKPDEIPNPDEGEQPDETPDEQPTPDEEEKPEQKPEETLPEDPDEEEEPDKTPEQKPNPDEGEQPEETPEQTPTPDGGQKPEQKPEQTPTPDEGQKPEQKPEQTPTPGGGQKPEQKPEQTPTPGGGQKPEQKPEQTPTPGGGQKPEQKPVQTSTPDEGQKPEENSEEILALDEEEKAEETSDEILTSEEEQKTEEITEETLIQDQGKIINAKEPDITVEETSPKTAWSKIILIIIVVVGILISIFYINKKRNLFRNSKN